MRLGWLVECEGIGRPGRPLNYDGRDGRSTLNGRDGRSTRRLWRRRLGHQPIVRKFE